MKKKIMLMDDSRIPWAHLLGKTKIFRGTVSRFGHKHRQGKDIKRGATLCLVDVHLKHSNKIIDHVWVNYTSIWAVFGEVLKPGAVVEFTATVAAYDKGGKHIYGRGQGVYQDLELINCKNLRAISHPRLVQSDLIDDNLVSYAIATKTNITRGTYLGQDPQGKLGKIYVGQTFANRLARYLSYKWST